MSKTLNTPKRTLLLEDVFIISIPRLSKPKKFPILYCAIIEILQIKLYKNLQLHIHSLSQS